MPVRPHLRPASTSDSSDSPARHRFFVAMLIRPQVLSSTLRRHSVGVALAPAPIDPATIRRRLIVACAGDKAMCARVAQAHNSPEELAATLDRLSAEELAEAYPAEEPGTSDATGGSDAEAEPATAASLIEALSNEDLPHAVPLVVELSPGVRAVVGGPNHGVVEILTRKGADGEPQEVAVQAASWIVWRPEVVVAQTADDAGRTEPIGEPSWGVEIVDRQGRRERITGLGSADSVDIPALAARVVGVDARTPVATKGRAQLRQCAEALGRDEREIRSVFATMGWAFVDGKATYLAPAGSVTADGARTDLVVGPPPSADDASLSDAEQCTGWPEMSSDDQVAEDAEVIEKVLAVVPGRHEVPVLALGAVFAAPLALAKRASGMVVGVPHAQKSWLLAVAQGFVSSVDVNNSGGQFSITLPQSSVAGASAATEWHRHSVTFADNYRLDDKDANRNATMRQMLEMLLDSSYSGGAGKKAQQTGGGRAMRKIRAIALVSAEAGAEATAMVERSCVARLNKGDVDDGALDHVIEVLDAGAGRRIYARYLSWLAARIDEKGLAAFSSENAEQVGKIYASYRNDRAGETTAVFAAGWYRFYEFAKELGFADSLPPWGSIRTALRTLVATNSGEHQQASVSERLGRAFIESLAAGSLHLTLPDGNRPIACVPNGWLMDHGGYSSHHEPGGRRIGIVDAGYEHILIGGMQAIKELARIAGLSGLSDDILRRGIDDWTGVRVSKPRHGFVANEAATHYRPGGWVVPISILDDDDNDNDNEEEL